MISPLKAINMTTSDPYDLKRFIDAQEGVYEIRPGRVEERSEALALDVVYFPPDRWAGYERNVKILCDQKHRRSASIPGASCAWQSSEMNAPGFYWASKGHSALQIFGSPDDLKLKSSMTLFASVSSGNSLFQQVLDKYYHGDKGFPHPGDPGAVGEKRVRITSFSPLWRKPWDQKALLPKFWRLQEPSWFGSRSWR